jgi:hypothetical protein
VSTVKEVTVTHTTPSEIFDRLKRLGWKEVGLGKFDKILYDVATALALYPDETATVTINNPNVCENLAIIYWFPPSSEYSAIAILDECEIDYRAAAIRKRT